MSAKGFDRGTPAGNLVHNLYNKKNMDSTLDPELLARVKKYREQQDATAKPKVKPVPKSRAHVNVPKLNKFHMSDDERRVRIAEYKLASYGSKKKATTISDEQEGQEAQAAPVPSRPLITDHDKMKLQFRMEFGEDLPQPAPAGRSTNYPRRDLELERFNELRGELAERREFLKELQSDRTADGKPKLCGDYDKHERRLLEQNLLREIQDRVDEMKDLDKKMAKRPVTSYADVEDE